ncbi:hypothetical protein [Pyxidicoccus xibeiensis]|uniref:hypothetical protein n=1 Tax=Pyxidicoccus xibeiensis TaxID=2906759 RepID=UPI0020A75210|nr:hypothetical protein [Pyxidicoccus xibeiensis]MCP3142120.1 hypothetical protein [Pyxidicoccus xibeiensis]
MASDCNTVKGQGWRYVWLGLVLCAAACGPVPDGDGEARGDVQEEALAVPSEEAAVARVRDVLVSRPFGVNKPRLEPREFAASDSSVAWDGRQFLVVWRDERPGGMFAARVKPDGTVLDPAGIPLNVSGSLDPGIPNVVFDGRQFVVAWVADGVFGVHVGSDGRVLRRFTVLNSGEVGGGAPGLACSPDVCVIGFSVSDDEGSDLAISRVSSSGVVLSPTLTYLTPGGGTDIVGEPAAAWDGTQFLVTWTDSRGGFDTPDIYGARVLAGGTIRDPGGFPISSAPGEQRVSSVVWTGHRFLVVWDDARGVDRDIYGARVFRSGRVDETDGFPISTAPGDQRLPRVAHLGGRSLVVWQDARDGALRVRGAKVKEDATVEESGLLVSHGDYPDEGRPAVAAGADRYLVSYASLREGISFGSAILATRVERDGDALDRRGTVLTRAADAQMSPVVTSGADGYLVVWRDFRAPERPALFAARLRPDGTVRDARGILLPAGPEASGHQVAWDGRVFLVVWEQPGSDGLRDIRGARVSRSGELLDTAGLEVAVAPETQASPAVASSGDGFLVTWTDERAGTGVWGTRVSRGGDVLDPGGFRITPELPGVSQGQPAMTALGSGYLLVYRTTRAEGFFFFEGLRALRLSATGSVLDASPLIVAPDSPDLSYQDATVASDGREALVVWAEFDELFVDSGDLRMRRVTREGAVLEPVDAFVATGPELQEEPTVIFDGRDYLVAWESSEPLILPGSSTFDVPDIEGARVSREGRVRERFPISTHESGEFAPSLASVGDGRSVVFYWEFLVSPEAMNDRVQGRLLRNPDALH